MTSRSYLLLLSTLLSLVAPIATQAQPQPAKISNPSNNSVTPCKEPALSRLVRHKVAPKETLESIAQQYNLIPATLMGMNPALRNGKVNVGSEIQIPPYNGIRVEVPAGQTWRNVAENYKVRPDVLFEVNGCQTNPKVVFVPGVNWTPERPPIASSKLTGYPLPTNADVALGYGWQVNPNIGTVFFHSGLDLLAAAKTPVRSVSEGIVAFAGEQGSYGNLVVVNHSEGLQSRYAQLSSMRVKVGQKVKQGDLLGTVGATGEPSATQTHLHFEIRYASSLGWIAEDPVSMLQGARGEKQGMR